MNRILPQSPFTALLFLVILGGIGLSIPSCADDDHGLAPALDLPVLYIDDVTVLEGDQDDTLRLLVRLEGTNTTNAIFSFGVLESTAQTPSDYTILTPVNMRFGISDTEQYINIEVRADENKEPTEKIKLKFYNPVNCRFNQDVVTITIEDDDDNIADLVIPSGGATSPESYPGYNLVWSDEFDGDVVDPSNWTFEIGDGCPGFCGWGNNELEYYREENTDIVDGHLVITAKRQAFGNRDYTSSRLITKGKRQFKFACTNVE